MACTPGFTSRGYNARRAYFPIMNAVKTKTSPKICTKVLKNNCKNRAINLSMPTISSYSLKESSRDPLAVSITPRQ